MVLVDSAGACMDTIDLSFGLIKEDVCFAFIAFLRGGMVVVTVVVVSFLFFLFHQVLFPHATY